MDCPFTILDLNSLPPAGGFLSDKETAFLQTLTFPKRRTEWLGGRLALKQAASHVLGVADLKQIEVLARNGGKPDLIVQGSPSKLAFSITHSNGYAAAVVSTQCAYIGLDLEKVEHRLSAWAKDFFHPSELTAQGDPFLTSLWTQKEAVVKLLGRGLSLNSYDVRVVGGVAQFYGAAQEVYHALGSPVVELAFLPAPQGFVLCLATARAREGCNAGLCI